MSKWDQIVTSDVNDKTELKNLENDYARGEFLQNMLISTATGGQSQRDDQYKKLRRYFMESEHANLLPFWVKSNRDLGSFWPFIQEQFSTYRERRAFIRTEFDRLLSALEANCTCLIVESVNLTMRQITHANLNSYWNKAIKRVGTDPEGAITIAKTLLEGSCKEILDRQCVEYDDDKITLPKLYKITAKSLQLHSTQHIEKIFKSILGGCSAIVGGLGNVRNELGDAHHRKIKPLRRHAELAVNMAGSMAKFLFQTLEDRMEIKKGKKQSNDNIN
ncbi:MAG: abortive infection family protein [Gammaproteobacteria bacterium]|jgi:hypothetical protein